MQLTFEGKTIDQVAIELIQACEPQGGYRLCYSGGKDSDVCLDLTKRAEAKFTAIYNESPLDPPEVRNYIKTHHPEVRFENHAQGFFTRHFMSHGLPLRRRRWCCEIIKESGGTVNEVKIMGMRAEESRTRSHYKCFMPNTRLGTLVLPIIGWKTSDVWQYIGERHLQVCGLYRQGWKRIGCLLCPYASKEEIKLTLQQYPNLVRAYKSACERYLVVRRERGTPLSFKTGEEYFNWWTRR